MQVCSKLALANHAPKMASQANMLHWNARSLPPKLSELKPVMNKFNVKVACISETHTPVSKPIKVKGFQTFQINLSDSAVWGNCIIVHNSVASKMLAVSAHDSAYEFIAVQCLLWDEPV